MNGGTRGDLADLEQQACAWIRSLQRDHGATATPLPEKRRDHLAQFFPVSTVNRVRVCTVSEIPTPPFLVEAVGAGLPLLDFHLMAAFTAGDLVLINPVRITGRDDVARRMLFHEVVHVHQYGALGLETFMHEYLSSVVAYRNYRTIPLEAVAYEAQDRYVLNPDEAFSVDEMVRSMRRWSEGSEKI
jgi:hypothetical protein